MKFNPFIFTKSFLSYLQGDNISEDERKNIEQVIEDSPEIQELYNELQDKDKTNEQLSIIASFNVDSAYSKITGKNNKSNKFALFQKLVAAAIALLIIIPTTLWITEDEEYDSTLIGRGKTTFKTSDGKVLSLDTITDLSLENNLLLSNENGTLVINENKETPKDSPKANVIDVPNKGMHKVILPDGTKVHLNSGSTLEFSDDFYATERTVTLNGEALFEVVKSEDNPFIVKTKDISIKVLGTKFNVKSYDSDKTYTTLLEGEIELLNKNLKIQPGEQLIFDKLTKAIDVKDIDIEPIVAWSEKMFHFDRTPLEEIMQRLSRWYDLDIKYLDNDPNIKNTEYSGKIKMYTHPEDVLRKFEQTGNLKFELKKNTIIISLKKKS